MKRIVDAGARQPCIRTTKFPVSSAIRANPTVLATRQMQNGGTRGASTWSGSSGSHGEGIQGRVKEKELRLVREVASGLIGCASAAIS